MKFAERKAFRHRSEREVVLAKRTVRIVEIVTGRVVNGVVRPAAQSDKVLWTHWHNEGLGRFRFVEEAAQSFLGRIRRDGLLP